LGALFRDKDFRGNSFEQFPESGLLFHTQTYRNFLTSWAIQSTLEQTEIPLAASDLAGRTGDHVVHVDGNQGNYSLLTNFRTNRGGSVFSAANPHPGGEVAAIYPSGLVTPIGADDTRVNVLIGRAYLVRNAVTNVGLNEVSAGNELMLLIHTTSIAVTKDVAATDSQGWFTALNTNGFLEGNSAADLYRIEGRPLVNDFRKEVIDPSAIILTRRTLNFIT
jgi:hypothetical protein